MVQFHCLNPIAACGLELFPDTYEKTDDFNAAEVALVRSAAMHDMDLPESLLAVARAGQASTIFHWKMRRSGNRCIQYTRCKRKRCQRAGDRRHASCKP